MRTILCDECRKELFTTERTNNGGIGAEAQSKGFVYKLAVLWTDKYDSLFFCTKECQREFYRKNIPTNPEVSKVLEELRNDIPKMAKECSEGLARLQKGLITVMNNRRKHGNNY